MRLKSIISLLLLVMNSLSVCGQFQVDGNYSISGNLGVGLSDPTHNLQVNGRTVQFSNQHAIYRWRWGGGTDLVWKKIADIQLANLSYRCAAMEVEIFNTGSNHGYSVLGQKMRFFVAARRSGTNLNDRDYGLVSGPVADYVRLVKIETGKFELQVRQVENWRDMEVVAKQSGGFDSPVTYIENPVNGSAIGDVYMPEPSHIDYFTNGQFAGKIGIGTKPQAEYALSINGTICAKEIKVETNWADFVFEDDYPLMPISGLKQFIQDNRHLPEIPTEKEVEGNGISLGEINSKLLQKVEELTLYLIQLKEENIRQNQANEQLTKRVSQLEKLIETDEN